MPRPSAFYNFALLPIGLFIMASMKLKGQTDYTRQNTKEKLLKGM
jgi:hypothetical protein